MRTLLLLTLAAGLSILGSGTALADDPKPSVKDDLEAIQGKWQTGEKAAVKMVLEFKDKDISFNVRRPGVTIEVAALPFGLKEAGKTRWIEIDKDVAAASEVPSKIVYAVGKDELRLTIKDGKVKGEHRLVRVKK